MSVSRSSRTDVVQGPPLFAAPPGTFAAARADAATEGRIDAMATVAKVDAGEVRRILKQRTQAPSAADISDAIQSVRLAAQARELFGGAR